MKRIVLIGYGKIARSHLEVFRELNAEIVASCNRSEEKNHLARTEGNIAKTYTDYHRMILEQRPDGIIVCVSFWEIENVLGAIIPYGVPVLSEKPTATTLNKHLELIRLAEMHHTPLMVGMNRRHYSIFQKAIEHAGGKDHITSVLVEWSEDPFHLINNRKLTPDQVNRYIFGNSIHGIDLMVWLAGGINEPRILVRDHGYPYRWIMNVSGVSDSGVVYNFNSSWDNPVPWRVVFTARDRRYVFAPLEKCFVIEGRSKQNSEILPDDYDQRFKAGFYRQANNFLQNNYTGNDMDSVTGSMKIAELLTNKFLSN